MTALPALLSGEEIAMLRTVETYGNGIDFGGPRASRKVKSMAKSLIARGLLYGDYRNCGLADLGRSILHQEGG